MDLPGVGSALDDPKMVEKAERVAERLLEELKKSVGVDVKDLGVLRKELRVTVPEKIIGAHMSHNYDEMTQDALVPGFRKGRAPRKLLEKRFGGEVRESLKTTLVGQSFYAAAENAKLAVLGDPLFRVKLPDNAEKLVEFGEALTHLALPDRGDFSYACEIEIKPDFELPELKGIEVKTPKVDITDAMVTERIERELRIGGRYAPLTDGAADKDDLLVADVVLRVDGTEVKREDNVQLGVRATRLDGVPLLELAEALRGAKAGDTRSSSGTIPNDYERADLRGKRGDFEFRVHEVKRLEALSMAEFVAERGFADEADARKFYADELEDERDRLIERAKREQIYAFLLANTNIPLPEALSSRQTDRAVVRRVVELQRGGVPIADVEARIDELRTSASEEVSRELRLEFIMEKVAAKFGLRVTDEEVNTEIARMARLYNKRFDRVRDDLHAQGLLAQLAERIRQEKCVKQLLMDAKIVDAA